MTVRATELARRADGAGLLDVAAFHLTPADLCCAFTAEPIEGLTRFGPPTPGIHTPVSGSDLERLQRDLADRSPLRCRQRYVNFQHSVAAELEKCWSQMAQGQAPGSLCRVPRQGSPAVIHQHIYSAYQRLATNDTSQAPTIPVAALQRR